MMSKEPASVLTASGGDGRRLLLALPFDSGAAAPAVISKRHREARSNEAIQAGACCGWQFWIAALRSR